MKHNLNHKRLRQQLIACRNRYEKQLRQARQEGIVLSLHNALYRDGVKYRVNYTDKGRSVEAYLD